jgi:hypothetical protein
VEFASQLSRVPLIQFLEQAHGLTQSWGMFCHAAKSLPLFQAN